MKKLYFLLPLASWILAYFLWDYSGQFISNDWDSAKEIWWIITDFGLFLLTLALGALAIEKN